jgi:predicted kinase
MASRRSVLIATRGLPGCGKTTRARAWVAGDPTRRARYNRDDARIMLHGGRLATADQEKQVTVARDAAVTALLKRGVDVVVDDTTLAQRYARDLRKLAARAGADFVVWDMTDVQVEVCIERDRERTGTAAFVGEQVIRDMHRRYLAGKTYPLPLPEEAEDVTEGPALYSPQAGAATAIMVDLDGTTAIMCARSPYDETRVGEDTPNRAVIEAVKAMYAAGHEVIFCSGRTEACREATEKWLAEHVGIPYVALYMRAVGDMRKDSIVKVELFDQHIRKFWDVVAVFDDRKQVVDMWRSIGLTVFQVAPGDF